MYYVRIWTSVGAAASSFVDALAVHLEVGQELFIESVAAMIMSRDVQYEEDNSSHFMTAAFCNA